MSAQLTMRYCPAQLDLTAPAEEQADDSAEAEAEVGNVWRDALAGLEEEDGGHGGGGDGGDRDDGGARSARPPVPEPAEPLSEAKSDRVVMATLLGLVAGGAALLAAVLVGGALGWIQPVCGGSLVTQTARCARVTQPPDGRFAAATVDSALYSLTGLPTGTPVPQPGLNW